MKYNKDVCMLLAIDPGINTTGLAVLDIAQKVVVKETVLVKNARKFTPEEKLIEEAHGTRVVKVLAITNKIEELLDKYKEIDTIVAEAPFYNSLTPMAYGSLLEVISAIRYMVAYQKSLPFKLIEPLVIKRLFTSKAMASKELIKHFLHEKKKDGSIIIDIDIDTLSEHEIDAVAIGFVHRINQLSNQLAQPT